MGLRLGREPLELIGLLGLNLLNVFYGGLLPCVRSPVLRPVEGLLRLLDARLQVAPHPGETPGWFPALARIDRRKAYSRTFG